MYFCMKAHFKTVTTSYPDSNILCLADGFPCPNAVQTFLSCDILYYGYIVKFAPPWFCTIQKQIFIEL